MKVITLTLCPAFDIHCAADTFVPFKENAVRITSRNAGGKGVNISRALNGAGIPNTALVVVGEENGEEFLREIAKLNVLPLRVAGRIRENITLHSAEGETRISFAGFSVQERFLQELIKVMPSIESGDIVTLTGRLPDGFTVEMITPLLEDIKACGGRVVIDSNSFTPQDLIRLRPWLIKPNEQEIVTFTGRQINTPEQACEVAEQLHRQGIENVMISLGDKGAVLVNERGAFTVSAPVIAVRSTIGAGDSSIAGFITAWYQGLRDKAALQTAVAFGCAACLTEGTAPPQKQDVAALLGQITNTL